MKNRIVKNPFKFKDNLDSFKIRFFRISLFVILFFLGFEVVRSLVTAALYDLVLVHIGMIGLTIITIIALIMYQKYLSAAIIYGLGWLIAFVFYWLLTFGADGANSYMFFALLVTSAVILPQPLYPFYAFLLCTVCLYLSLYFTKGWTIPEYAAESTRNFSLAFYYLLHSAITGFTVVLLKFKFEKERYAFLKAKEELDQVNDELTKKGYELQEQKSVVASLQENLEDNVKQRTIELDEKNNQLSQHAYNNAHIIRGPLSNIQGILSLLNAENNFGAEKKRQLSELCNKVNQLDSVVKKVNRILS